MMFRLASPDLGRVIGFALYHLRFWFIVLILFITIPNAELDFVVGTFAGILIPKMIMGYYVTANMEQEWWLIRTSPEQKLNNANQKLNNARLEKLNSAGQADAANAGQAKTHCIYFRSYQPSEPRIRN